MAICMHKGATRTTPTELAMLPTPQPAGPAHYPVDHARFVDLIDHLTQARGYGTNSRQYFLNREGAHLFGMYELVDKKTDYAPLLAFRNSHDMAFAASIAIGLRVFVCDNLCFSGEILISRKHTKHIWDELPDLVACAMDESRGIRQKQDERIEVYKNYGLTEELAALLMLEAHSTGVLPAAKIKAAWLEFNTDPLHYDPQDTTTMSYWRLYNAITHQWRQSPAQLIGPIHTKSSRLHDILDYRIQTTPASEVIVMDELAAA